jgi:O-antigen/teichoic acid export membrane protein
VTTARTTPVTGSPASLGAIARGGTANLIGAGISAVATFAVVAIVTNRVPAEVAGSFFASTSVFLVAIAIAELGSDVSLARWLPHYLVERRTSAARICLRVCLRSVLIAGLICGAAMLVAGPPLAPLVGGATDQREVVVGLLALAVFVPIAGVYDTIIAATRGYGSMRPSALVERVGRSLVQVAAVALASLAGASLAWLSIAWAIPYAIGLVVGAWWLLRLVRQAEVDRRPSPISAAVVTREYWAYTMPRAVARICQILLQRADIILVAVLRSPTEAAVYTAATRFLVLGQLVALAVQNVLAPQLSKLLARGDRVAAERVFQVTTAWTMAVTWPLYLLSVGLAPLLLSVFGGSYGSGELVVVLLALSTVVSAVCGPVDTVLLMAGGSGRSLINNALALLVDLALDILLIPSMGMLGAAIGWAAAIVVRNVLPLLQVRGQLRMTPFTNAVWWVAALTVLCFGVPPLVLRYFFGLQWWSAAALVGVSCAVYAVALLCRPDLLALDSFASMLPRRLRPLITRPASMKENYS